MREKRRIYAGYLVENVLSGLSILPLYHLIPFLRLS